MKEDLSELYRYRELLYMFAYRDIKIKYKQSILGVFWAILMPALVVVSGVVVRYAFALMTNSQLNTTEMVGVAVKSIPWAFLVSSIRFACTSLIGNSSLVTKIYFPKEVFPLAAVLSQLFDFLVASSVLAVILMIARIGASVYLLWAPLLVFTLIVLVTGIGILVSAASLFFRDVKYLVEIFLMFGIFFTPVFYDVSTFGPRGRVLLLNPVTPILEGLRACIANRHSPDTAWILYSVVFGFVLLVGSYMFFKRLEPAFAENI
jgi:ABC-type polysaccharide/polyol phosphate export permease